MPYNNFNDIPILTQVAVFIAGVWGAVINWIDRNRRGKTMLNRFGYFVLDVFATVGISVMVFLVLIGHGYNELFSVGCSSFMAHYGTRSFYIMEVILSEKLKIDKGKFSEKK